jgi:hypothetical protein
MLYYLFYANKRHKGLIALPNFNAKSKPKKHSAFIGFNRLQ